MKHLLTLALVLCLGTFASAQIPSYVPTNGLVGWWPFNGNANDESGNGNHGTVNGATLAADRNGNAGKAYSFNGVSNITKANFSFRNGDYSVSFWFKVRDTSLNQRMVTHDWQNGGTFTSAFLKYGNNLSLISGQHNRDDGSITGNFVKKHSLNSINNWILFTVVTNGNLITLYLNDQFADSTFCNIPIGSTNTLFFGGDYPFNPFNGLLDDIAIYNRALTAAEVQQLYTGQSACNLTVNLAPSDTLAACGNAITLNAGNPGANYLWNTGDSSQSISATQSGWYGVTVTQNNCSATDSVYVNLLQVDLGNDTTVCRGNSMIIAAKTPGNLNLPGNLRNGLVGYWPFNGNANDESGNVNNGTVIGATLTRGANGTPLNGYLFNSSSGNYIGLPNPFFGGGQVNTFTIHTRVKIDNISNSPNIWGKTFFWGEVNLLITNSGEIVLFWANSISGNKYSSIYSDQGIINAGEWNNIAVVFANSNAIIFVNGKAIKTNLQWSSQGGGLISTTQIESTCNFAQDAGSSAFGARITGGSWGNYLDGIIDEFSIWDRPLTNSEIASFTIGNLESTLWSTGDTTPTINVTPTQTTTYYCTVSDGISTCTDSVTVFVTQPPVLSLPDTLRSATRPVVLAPGNASSYRWSTGDTTSNLSVNTAGTYSVTASNAAGCSSADSVLVLFSNPAPALPAAAAGMFNYQASVVSGGKPQANRSLSVRFTVADSTATNYSEIQQITTDTRGHFATQVGAGNPISGSLSDVSWWDGLSRTLKTEVDTNGSGNWVVLGSSSLVAVPVSMYALRSGDGSRSIYGSFDSNGNVVSGRGFSVTPLGNGKFELVFQQPFTELPNVFLEFTGNGVFSKKIWSINTQKTTIEISGNPDRIQFEAKGK